MPGRTILFLICAFLLVGCAVSQGPGSTSKLSLEYEWPIFKYDRYEQVVFPAGEQ